MGGSENSSELRQMTLEELKNYMDEIKKMYHKECLKTAVIENLAAAQRLTLARLGVMIDATRQAVKRLEEKMGENADGRNTGD